MNDLKGSDIYQKIYSKVLNFLSFKDRSEHETRIRIKKYLLKLSISRDEKQEIEDTIINSLYDLGLLNDEAYAKRFSTQKISGQKPESKYAIKQFLMKKGIMPELISKALEVYSPESELEKAKEAAQRKLPNIKESNKLIKKQKLFKYLHSKRFPLTVIYSAIDSIEELK